MTKNIHLSPELEKAFDIARQLEDIDQHLDTAERQALVNQFHQENPDIELPQQVDEAFVHIIFDLL